MAATILVVDDDPAISEMLTIVLESEGFQPIAVTDGNEAVPVFREHNPDLILLDLMLPGMNGVDICRTIRAESPVPIVMLTAKTDTVDVVLGLESGADDYITKPFKHKELIARIRARLRPPVEAQEAKTESSDVIVVGDLHIDVSEHTVTRDGEEISLTPLEFDLLLERSRKPGHVHTGRICSRRSGAISMPRIPAWLMFTCSVCARKSKKTLRTHRSCSRYVGWAIRPAKSRPLRR